MSIKPRKTRKIDEETDLPMLKPTPQVTESETPLLPAIKTESPKIVKVVVLVGTLHWEQGTFQKGDTFTCSQAELAKFGKDVEIVSS